MVKRNNTLNIVTKNDMKRHMNKNGKTKASMLKGSNKDSYNNT